MIDTTHKRYMFADKELTEYELNNYMADTPLQSFFLRNSGLIIDSYGEGNVSLKDYAVMYFDVTNNTIAYERRAFDEVDTIEVDEFLYNDIFDTYEKIEGKKINISTDFVSAYGIIRKSIYD